MLAVNPDVAVPLFAVGAFAVVASIAILASRHFDRKRKEALEAVATEMGLSFAGNNGFDVRESFPNAKLFSKGRGRKIKNMIHGQSGEVQVFLFDYFFVTGSGKRRRTHYQSVACFRSPQLGLPQFSMRPRSGFFDSIGRAFGGQDINFEEYPEFSHRYVLQGNDEAAIRGQFSHAALSFFEQNQGVCVEGNGVGFLFYRPRRKVKPFGIRNLFEQAYRVYAVLQQPTIQ